MKCSGHVPPRDDPGHAKETLSHGWPGNTSAWSIMTQLGTLIRVFSIEILSFFFKHVNFFATRKNVDEGLKNIW